uniref:Uncharacterized protein n=1 Tax=Magallana gigas TaxID=29159 RepID=K1QIY4_MAGGI
MNQIAEIEFWHRELANGQDDQCELSHSVRENVPEDTEEVHVTFTLDETVLEIVLGSSVILKEHALLLSLKVPDMRQKLQQGDYKKSEKSRP